jgi:hypothetical protein
MKEEAWRQQGEEPDYRFTLANERTFLAWIRTALAILAAGILLDQFSTRLQPQTLVVTGVDAHRDEPGAQCRTSPARGLGVGFRLSTLPALIFPGEIAQLRARLDAVARGEAFLLQGGDCAESFDDLGPVRS